MEIKKGFCNCGCNQKTAISKQNHIKYGWIKGQPRKYIRGHYKPAKGINLNEKNGQWRGNKVGYNALHNWIKRKLGKPSKCDNCGTVLAKKFEWANISGKYLRDLTDWERLCTKCHFLSDGRMKNLKQYLSHTRQVGI